MRLLVVGGGGREHALCWALRRENPDADLYCAPGNPGTAELATNLPIAADDLDRLADAADMHGIDLTVDRAPRCRWRAGWPTGCGRRAARCSGPSAAAAQLEASKAFAKEVMAAAGVPTAASRTFTDLGRRARVRRSPSRAAGGEGIGARGRQGRGRLRHPRRGRGRGARDARRGRPSATPDDRGDRGVPRGRGDLGPRDDRRAATSSCCPSPRTTSGCSRATPGPTPAAWAPTARCRVATPALLERVRREVLLPALDEMRRRGSPFSGVLYAGLMVDDEGTPWVVEFNCRLGDPETQVVLPLVSDGLTALALGRRTRRAALAARAAPGPLGDHGARLAGISRRPGEGRRDHDSRRAARGRDRLPRRHHPRTPTACCG